MDKSYNDVIYNMLISGISTDIPLPIYSITRAKDFISIKNNDSKTIQKLIKGYQYAFFQADKLHINDDSLWIEKDIYDNGFIDIKPYITNINNQKYNNIDGYIISTVEYKNAIDSILDKIVYKTPYIRLDSNSYNYISYLSTVFYNFIYNIIITKSKNTKNESKLKIYQQKKMDIATQYPFNIPDNGTAVESLYSNSTLTVKEMYSSYSNTISTLTYDNTNERIISNQETCILIVSLIIDLGATKTLDFLKQVKNRNQLLMQNPLMHPSINKYNLMLAKLKYRPTGLKGMYKCRCGSDEVQTVFVQTRSADEPMTAINYCHSCGNQWRG